MTAPNKVVIEKVAGLFGEYVAGAETILHSERAHGVGAARLVTADSLEVSPMAAFCYKLHMDQRVQEDDQFPLHGDSVDKAITNCLLVPWKGGRATPGYISNLIQDAPSEAARRKLEMIAVLQERETVVRWLQLRESEAPTLRLALRMFHLPVIADTAGNLYFGQWEFDRKISGKDPEDSAVLWAAQLLFNVTVGGRSRPQ